jgi:hypothetical protein
MHFSHQNQRKLQSTGFNQSRSGHNAGTRLVAVLLGGPLLPLLLQPARGLNA